MDFKNISNSDLSLRLEKLVRTERKVTHLVLLHIWEFEARKLYAELGYDRMYSYLTKHLGYSENCAYARLQSARLLNKTPEVLQKLENGSINLTQLTQIQKCLRNEELKGEGFSPEKTLEIISKVENKNSFDTKKVLAVEFNQPIQTHEVLRPQQDESIRIEMTLTKEQFKELEMAKSLLSHQCPNASWSELITLLAKKLNKTKLGIPAEEEKTVLTPKKKPSDSEQKITQSFTATAKNKRVHLSAQLKRTLLKKAQYCCEYRDEKTGRRCDSKYMLEIDHRIPLSLGGNNAVSNFRILCSAHNKIMARKLGLRMKT